MLGCHNCCLFFIFYNIRYIHSFNHIHSIHLSVAIWRGLEEKLASFYLLLVKVCHKCTEMKMYFTSALVSARLWARIVAGSRPAAPRAAVSPGAGSPRVAARDVRSSFVITRFCSRGFALPPSSEGRPAQWTENFEGTVPGVLNKFGR